MDKIQFTKEGLQKLQDELKELTEVRRPKAVERLTRARGMGDLRENSEYHAAKEDLSFLEGRILELEVVLKKAYVSDNEPDVETIEVGNMVKVRVNDNEEEYTIVGEFEADPMNRKVSNTSPIGRALMGKKAGDSVAVEVPAGTLEYKIVEIK